ncbi:MAG: COX15/CtaA family protein [Actinomycetota bacterium]|nr:COX15/CtaA family protein [Actinomycetota bacterium]
MTTDSVAATPAPRSANAPRGRARWTRWTRWTRSPSALNRLSVVSLIANVLIVVTGGAVRLTNSGLGCPTWPSCTTASLTPTRAYSFHGIIEFTNRQLTFIVGLLAALTLVAAWRQRRQTRLAAIGLIGIPAQALLGGITVLTDLNPYAVAGHFLLSMTLIAVYATLMWRLTGGQTIVVPVAAARFTRGILAITVVVLTIGTVVTGSGPHAGDLKAGRLHRIHLSASGVSQLHADAVMVLIGATLGLLAVAYAVGALERLRRAAGLLLAVELGQGLIGFTQYFLHVPPLLVVLHMFGACLVWLAAVRLVLLVEPAAGIRGAG